MEWPPQSPALNPTENLWTDVKKAVHTCNPTSNEALRIVVKKSWERIPITRCQDLENSMPWRCEAVIANKGYSTKYILIHLLNSIVLYYKYFCFLFLS